MRKTASSRVLVALAILGLAFPFLPASPRRYLVVSHSPIRAQAKGSGPVAHRHESAANLPMTTGQGLPGESSPAMPGEERQAEEMAPALDRESEPDEAPADAGDSLESLSWPEILAGRRPQVRGRRARVEVLAYLGAPEGVGASPRRAGTRPRTHLAAPIPVTALLCRLTC